MRSFTWFRNISWAICAAVVGFVATTSIARADVEYLYEPRFRLSVFRASGAGVIQAQSGYFFSPRIVWAPSIAIIREKLFFRAELGGLGSKTLNQAGTQPVILLNLLAAWREPAYLPFEIEAGVGAQMWFASAQERISLLSNLVVPVSDDLTTFMSRIKVVAGYTYLYDWQVPNHQIHFGLQLTIGPLGVTGS